MQPLTSRLRLILDVFAGLALIAGALLFFAGRILASSGYTARTELHYKAALQWGEDDPAIRQALADLAGAAPRRGFFGKAG